jgi:hypothetical protein
MSPEQQQMQAMQEQANRQQEQAALKAGLEKSRHDAIMAIIGKIG